MFPACGHQPVKTFKKPACGCFIVEECGIESESHRIDSHLFHQGEVFWREEGVHHAFEVLLVGLLSDKPGDLRGSNFLGRLSAPEHVIFLIEPTTDIYPFDQKRLSIGVNDLLALAVEERGLWLSFRLTEKSLPERHGKKQGGQLEVCMHGGAGMLGFRMPDFHGLTPGGEIFAACFIAVFTGGP